MQSDDHALPVVDVPVIPLDDQHHSHTETSTRIGLSAHFMGNSARFFFARETVTDNDSEQDSNTSCCSWFNTQR